MSFLDKFINVINPGDNNQNSIQINDRKNVMDDISKHVSEVLSTGNLVDSFCYFNKRNQCNGFLSCEENGEIIINPSYFNTGNSVYDEERFQLFKTKINEFISYIFNEGYIFKSPNLYFINLILYGTREEVLNYLSLDDKNKILAQDTYILDKKGKINQKIIFELYKSITINEPDSNGIGYIEFDKFDIKQFKLLFGGNGSFSINIDDFFYGFWNQNPDGKEDYIIRYGLPEIYGEIEKVLLEDGNRETLNGVKIPYTIKKPKNATDDSLTELTNLGVKKKPITDKLGRVDYKQYETIFPEIKKGEIFLEYVAGNNGYYGIGLNGLPIKDNVQIEALKIDISNIVKSGMEFVERVEEDGRVTFIALEDFFISKKGDLKKGGYLDFSKSIIIRSDIDNISGNIILSNPNLTILKSNIANGYGIRCNLLQYSGGNIYGFIICKSHISIDTAHISGANITSYGGNITVGSEKNNKQLISGSEIYAPGGKVTIYGNVEHTTIFADEVEIIGKVTATKIVAKKVKINEVDKNSHIIAGNINVGKNHGLNNKYTLIVTNALHGRENQLNFLKLRLEKASEKEKLEIKKSIEMLHKMEKILLSIYGEPNSNIFSIGNLDNNENDITSYRMISHTFGSSGNPEENLADLKFLLEVSSTDSIDQINIGSVINKMKTFITLEEASKLLQDHYSTKGVESRRSDLRRKIITKQTIPVNISNFKGSLFEISERGCQIDIEREIIGLKKGDVIDVSFTYTNGKISEQISSPLLIVRVENGRLIGLFLLVSVENKISRIISSLEVGG